MTFRNLSMTLLLVAMTVALLGAVSAPALAGPNGTTSGETTANALPTGDTFPQAAGEMSVQWTNTTGSDTQFDDSGPGNVVTTVDTGFDMSQLSDPANQSLTAGDSVVYTVGVQNLGNNASPTNFNFQQTVDSGVTGSFTWELFEEASGNNSFDTGLDTRLTGNAGSIAYSENERDTIYAVITAKSAASDGDTLGNKLFATDNAPINGAGSNINATTGDQWERGTVIASADQFDTQNVFYRTTVAGPVLSISKSFDNSRASGSFRPGDTVAYTITVENTGGDTATNVEVVDAMPDSTTLSTVNGANVLNGNTLSSTSKDNDLGGDNSFENDAGTNSATERIKWAIDTIGPSGQTNNSVTLTFRVTID